MQSDPSDSGELQATIAKSTIYIRKARQLVEVLPRGLQSFL